MTELYDSYLRKPLPFVRMEGRLISRAGRVLNSPLLCTGVYYTLSYLWRAEVELPHTTKEEIDYPIYYGPYYG